MKKILSLSFVALLAIPAFANSTRTTTTRTYDSTSTTPMTDSEIQREEERRFHEESLNSEYVEQERMEDGIDYTDRTRTNRERKALNTGGSASDDN